MVAKHGINRKDVMHFEQSGRANNFAFGYSCSASYEYDPHASDDDTLLGATMNNTRRFLERCSYTVRNINIMHSLAGGTGSGFGCRLLETYAEYYPKICLSTVSVAPFLQGDTPLQNYNSLLRYHYHGNYFI